MEVSPTALLFPPRELGPPQTAVVPFIPESWQHYGENKTRSGGARRGGRGGCGGERPGCGVGKGTGGARRAGGALGEKLHCARPAAKAPSGWTLQLRRGQQGTGHRRVRKPRALAGLGAGALALRAPVGSARPEEMQPPGEAEPVWGTAVEEPACVPVPRGSPCFKATHARPSRGGGCSKAARSAPGWGKRRALTKNKLADRVRRSKRPPQISKGRLHNPSLLPNGASLHFYRVARV